MSQFGCGGPWRVWRSKSCGGLLKRMQIAETEMKEYANRYDYQIVNADGKLEKAVEEVVAILKKEGYTLE